MKILFVSANRLKRVMPPMPLGLASVIGQIDESRHDIEVLDLMFSEDPVGELKSVLSRFDPVSIKMAKEQNLSLNPSKISGMCGRLMCCLTYEHAYYEKAKKDIPKMGKKVNTRHGQGKVIRQNILRKTLTVLLESGEEKEMSYRDVIKNKKKPKRSRKE